MAGEEARCGGPGLERLQMWSCCLDAQPNFPKTTLETVYYNEMNIRFIGRELWRDVRLSQNRCNKTELGNNFGFNVCKK